MKGVKGIHILLDLYGCDAKILDDSTFLNDLITRAVSESGLNSFGTLYHKFQPMGYTSVTLLAASHISIHTWPEYGYVAIDIFACDNRDKAFKAAEIIINALKPKRVRRIVRLRGYIFNKELVREGGIVDNSEEKG
jgi:S-adenosylmethionine decarboxylase